jgi:3-hydroxyisobutyrate dehydrogenase-like beta-hydroxyacid dehydrogenase
VKKPDTVALLGLGEAGAALAADLAAAGVHVRGFDPDPSRDVPGVERQPTGAAAADGADVVVSANAAALAAADGLALAPSQLYADLNTTSAGVKRRVAELVAPAAFADVAVLGPVRGLTTPCLASGAGADAFAAAFGALGMPVESIGGEPGDAATRKLVRSVFMKGVAAAVLESLEAAEAAGAADWLRAEIDSVLGAPLVDRLVDGSRRHAARRVEEMTAAAELLRELGVEPHVADAARAALEQLRDVP